MSKRWDEVYCSYTFYFKAQSPEEQERNQEYLRLRKIEFKANYGDYLGQELQEFRASLKEKKKPLVYNDPVHRAARNLGAGRGGVKTWSEIAEELTEELNQTNWSRMRRDVDIACDFLNLDPQHMVWLIKEWGDRNRKVHNRIREHIENCQWNLLADQLCRDLKELANVEVDKDELAKYEEVMVHIRERYFIVYNRDDPRFWFANDRAKKKSKDLATKLKENP